eukprot:225876-Pelagomonas_calceolata.AAC.5
MLVRVVYGTHSKAHLDCFVSRHADARGLLSFFLWGSVPASLRRSSLLTTERLLSSLPLLTTERLLSSLPLSTTERLLSSLPLSTTERPPDNCVQPPLPQKVMGYGWEAAYPCAPSCCMKGMQDCTTRACKAGATP